MWLCRNAACDHRFPGPTGAKDMSDNSKHLNPLIGFGVLTAVLYFLLFYFEDEIVEITSKGGWSFLIPVAIAFAISYGHGNFTSAFWDWLGIKAKH
jgi:hypothetical protein